MKTAKELKKLKDRSEELLSMMKHPETRKGRTYSEIIDEYDATFDEYCILRELTWRGGK